MDLSHQRAIHIVAALLIALAATQTLYTGLYLAEVSFPRTWLWGLEGVLFTLLAAFAGAAMVQAGQFVVGWSAIACSAVLNVVQVGVGLTLFGPFREAAQGADALVPLAGAVVAFSFFVYNAAKLLIGLAALIFGAGQMRASSGAGNALGVVTAWVGAVALLANAAVMACGRDALVPSPLAGGSGVVATVLLALCLWSLQHDTGASRI